MDIAQIGQTVTWLDEQRRRVDQEMRQLEQRLTNQAGIIEEQARRIQQLEGELATTRAQLAQYASLQEALNNLRAEVRLMIERLEEDRLARERDQERLRAAERERIGRALATVRRELERLRPLEEGLEVRQVEERRLSESLLQLRQALTELEKRLEERTRPIAFLTEQRSQDHKRIAQLQQETVELFKRLETLVGKLALVEDKVQRQESTLAEVSGTAEELRREQQVFLEEARQIDMTRQQLIQHWEETLTRVQEHVDQAVKRLEVFQVQYDRAVQAVTDIERWQAELRRHVNEAREAQRIAEERVQNHMREFEEDQEKRWKKHVLEWDYRWREHSRRMDGLEAQFKPILQQLELHQQLVDQLWRLQEEYGSQRLAEAQRLLKLIEETMAARERTLKTRTPPEKKAEA